MKIKKALKIIVNRTVFKWLKISKDSTENNKYSIGRYSYAPEGKFIRSDTVIGQFTSIAENVYIAPGNHPIAYLSTSPFYYAPYNKGKKIFQDDLAKKVEEFNLKKKCEIGNDVWIGVNVVVLQGVKIGDGAIIGANAVVTKDVPEYAIVGGNPAKVIKYRFDERTIENLKGIRWWDLPMRHIVSLKFDDINGSIEKVKRIREQKNSKKGFVS